MRCLWVFLAVLLFVSCTPPESGPKEKSQYRTDSSVGSLIPSRDEVQRQRSLALANDLAATIEQLGGVERARVHLDLADRSILSRDRTAKSKAAIVIVSGPGEVPASRTIKRLAGAAIPGLSPEQVSVFFSGASRRGEPLTERIGPFDVLAASAPAARACLAGLIGISMLLAVGLIGAGIKIRKLRENRR